MTPRIRYYLDTEFNSFGGSLLSLGICREDGESLYLVVPATEIERITAEEGMDPWIITNILPILYSVPTGTPMHSLPSHLWGEKLSEFIYRDGEVPQVIVDWPSDAMDFCKLLICGPGQAVPMGTQTHITIIRHVDIYPTTVEGAMQHNAMWDALAIRAFIQAGD